MTVFIIVLAVINFLIRIPFFNMPLHHDELTFFDGILRIFQNNLNPFIEFWGYKPPVFYELAAVFFRIFGPSRVWGRLIIDVFSSLSLIFTYLLGKKIFSARTGFLAALLLFFSPMFMGQSFLYQPPVLLTFLTLVTLYCYFSHKKFLYLIFASLLVLTHETTIFVIILLFLFNCLQKNGKTIPERFKGSFYIGFPMIFLLLWILLNKISLGWFLWPAHFSLLTSNRAYPRESFNLILDLAIKDNLLWVMFVTILLGLLFTLRNKNSTEKLVRKEVLFFVVLFFFYLIIFYWLTFLPRYMLFWYPLIFLSFVWSLEKFLTGGKVLLISFIVGIFLLTYSYITFYNLFLSREPVTWAGERDLSFFRIALLQKKAADYIDSNFPDSVIVSIWPINQAFSNPIYGYVKTKKGTLFCGSDEDLLEAKRLLSRNERNIIFILFTSYWDDKCKMAFDSLFAQHMSFAQEIKSDIFPKTDQILIYIARKKNSCLN